MNDIITVEGELVPADEPSTIELLTKGEIDTQIATAKKYPRSIKAFENRALEMVTANATVARESIYVLPARRGGDGKQIEGPSVRFAEMIQSAWGNCRSGARIIQEGAEFITAQGVFHDLETNSAVTFEVRRRIVGKPGRDGSPGKRFGVDMIAVTANAACSIALRNAILKGVPKALWAGTYVEAKRTIAGDAKTFEARVKAAISAFGNLGVKKGALFDFLGVKGNSDITVDHLISLGGMMTAIEDGEMNVSEIIGETKPPAPEKRKPKEDEVTTAAPAPDRAEKAKPVSETTADQTEKAETAPDNAESAPEPAKPPPMSDRTAAEPVQEAPPGPATALQREVERELTHGPAAPPQEPASPADGALVPGNPSFDFEQYKEGVAGELAVCTTIDDLNEVWENIQEEMRGHIPETAQAMFKQVYQHNFTRIKQAAIA